MRRDMIGLANKFMPNSMKKKLEPLLLKWDK